MKRIVLDDAEVIHQGDRFVMVDGSPFEELMKSRWFQVKTMICVKVSLRPSVEAVYKRESFPIFLLSGLSLSTFISIGSLGNRMVLWYPYGYGKLVVSIYLKEKPDKKKTINSENAFMRIRSYSDHILLIACNIFIILRAFISFSNLLYSIYNIRCSFTTQHYQLII